MQTYRTWAPFKESDSRYTWNTWFWIWQLQIHLNTNIIRVVFHVVYCMLLHSLPSLDVCGRKALDSPWDHRALWIGSLSTWRTYTEQIFHRSNCLVCPYVIGISGATLLLTVCCWKNTWGNCIHLSNASKNHKKTRIGLVCAVHHMESWLVGARTTLQRCVWSTSHTVIAYPKHTKV